MMLLVIAIVIVIVVCCDVRCSKITNKEQMDFYLASCPKAIPVRGCFIKKLEHAL